MALKMLLLAFAVLLIAKETLGVFNCEQTSYFNCRRPSTPRGIPRDISQFRNRCQLTTSHMRCLKEHQDECGWDSIGFFSSPDILVAYYNAASELCEEGTSLNTFATENFECLSETLKRTKCRRETRRNSANLVRQMFNGTEYEPRDSFNLDCFEKALNTGCFLLAITENCGKDVGEESLSFIRRSRIVENLCTEQRARAVLDALSDVDLNEDQIKTVTLLLEKPV